MKYFANIKSIEELKKLYRKLAFANHPDRGGSEEEMKLINNEYDLKFAELKKAGFFRAGEATEEQRAYDAKRGANEMPEEFRNIINLLIGLDGLEIELCGMWLWIGGDTKKHKEALKGAGCKWCSKKKLWSWHPVGYEVVSKRRTSMKEIRAKYGSEQIVRANEKLALA